MTFNRINIYLMWFIKGFVLLSTLHIDKFERAEDITDEPNDYGASNHQILRNRRYIISDDK